eukprot:scaffold455_cov116-Isochrysis_galbana.AAC.1
MRSKGSNSSVRRTRSYSRFSSTFFASCLQTMGAWGGVSDCSHGSRRRGSRCLAMLWRAGTLVVQARTLSRRSARRRHRVARRAAGAASARASQSGDRRPSLATGACRGAGYGPSGVRRPQPREACAVAARPAAAPSERGAPLRHASGRAARPSRAQSECSPSTRGLPRGPSLCPASLREAGTAACTQLSPQCSRRATLLRRSRPGARPQRRADRPGCRRSRRRGRSWAPTGVARKCLVTRRYAPRSERGVEGGSGSEGWRGEAEARGEAAGSSAHSSFRSVWVSPTQWRWARAAKQSAAMARIRRNEKNWPTPSFAPAAWSRRRRLRSSEAVVAPVNKGAKKPADGHGPVPASAIRDPILHLSQNFRLNLGLVPILADGPDHFDCDGHAKLLIPHFDHATKGALAQLCPHSVAAVVKLVPDPYHIVPLRALLLLGGLVARRRAGIGGAAAAATLGRRRPPARWRASLPVVVVHPGCRGEGSGHNGASIF